MDTLPHLTESLRGRRDLDSGQLRTAALLLANEKEAESEKADFLLALADKGESAAEVAGFAEAFRGMSLDPQVGEWSARAIDIVGTGGDHAGGFNVSSLVVLVLSCAGVPVMKHGNRGITSKCGSADLLAALGYDLNASPERLRGGLRELGYAFFFAPAYHPAFKHIAPVRRALAAQGRRTVFNILGPLINPGRPAHTVLGVYSPAWVPVLAQALHQLGCRSGLAVHGVIGEGKGIDEITTATDNHVCGAGALSGVKGTWRAADFGLSCAPFEELTGGDLQTNLAITEALISGRGPKGLEDTVVLNAAIALWVTGHQPGVKDGIELARELLTRGSVRAKIDATREYFAAKS